MRALVVELVDTKGFKIPRRSRCAGSSPAREPAAIKVYVLTDVANAILAQLVERNLAKVEVIGSNPMYHPN